MQLRGIGHNFHCKKKQGMERKFWLDGFAPSVLEFIDPQFQYKVGAILFIINKL